MPIQKNNESEAQTDYWFLKCRCGIKNHIEARQCWKCGADFVGSLNAGNSAMVKADDPNDAILSARLNSPDLCLKCQNTVRGNPCHKVRCFGTAHRENCGMCSNLQPVRYACCNQYVAKFGLPPADFSAFWRELAARRSA